MTNVLIEGAFYSPYASEGRWAFNICRLLAKMDIELYLLIPDLAKQHEYFKDFNPTYWFPNAKVVDLTTDLEFDTFFIIQGSRPHHQIKAKQRILGVFEAYWYGNTIDDQNWPANTKVVYAIEPHNDTFPHNNWPTKFETSLLPYSPYYQSFTSNYHNRGILLTIKDLCSPEFSEETIKLRLDHLRAAIFFKMHGIRVSVAMGHRLDVNQNSAHSEKMAFLLSELEDVGGVFYDRQSPIAMEQLIREHSVIYTGKVNEVMLYGAFQDALCLGSVPLIFSDWPEQFFKPNTFHPCLGMDSLIPLTHRLLTDESLYSQELARLRSNIDLYSQDEGIKILKGLIG